MKLKPIYLYVILILLSAVCFVAGLLFGSFLVNPFNMSATDVSIILGYRLPRSLEAYLVGASLGLSGAVLQIILRNPLADGFTAGVSSASAVGAVFALCLGVSSAFIPLFAVVFGVFGIALVLALSKDSLDYTTLILAGIVLNIISTALIGFLKYVYQESIGGIVFWLMGGFFSVSFFKAFLLFVVFAVVFVVFLRSSLEMNLLSFDLKSATSLGLDVRIVRMIGFGLSAALVAVGVSFSGIIAFVGLITPHIVRAVAGYDSKVVMIGSSLFGGAFLLVSDLLSRCIAPSSEELPVGILTSFIGGIFFFYLLLKNKKGMWYG
ncbi:FecCD family ABC transporter permease [Hippea maritima]|uniref:ABC-type transporter, integral membrane subunit n=1 Tax=Hippea maritima (strain ATCC 700847 / DSM 10411 / MH2) TaxID=760142 RepID=F2LU92_HIPMA|nr:iron ABC transporter permease [Hippea maritima]AEA34555.1 ABC-type transporter, integral membrane subunit [Hippea maritima DSM 10411]